MRNWRWGFLFSAGGAVGSAGRCWRRIFSVSDWAEEVAVGKASIGAGRRVGFAITMGGRR
jgi:hypothetical protein